MTKLLLACAVALAAGSPARASDPRTVEIAVTEDGFVPSPIKVKKGEPLTLVVTRKTDATCARHLVLDEEHIKQELPLGKPVRISFTPKKAGELKYGCAMGKMVAGLLRVE
jgi:plastocyanin domain-containing protein